VKYVKLLGTSCEDGYPITYWDCPHCGIRHIELHDISRNVSSKCPKCGGDVTVCTTWDAWMKRFDE
jgi:predicted RNA-binding Zn-ribbon protein involved in translation (DUF1610 family)